MRLLFAVTIVISFLISCSDHTSTGKTNLVIASGKMPGMATDHNKNIHIVYGTGDSIMYTYSSDNGKSFSAPSLISVLPALAASHARGPQIAVTNNGLVVVACNSYGDIFSYNKAGSTAWRQTARVNDIDTVAKENLMALSGDGDHVFAVWLDLRGNSRNKIYGASSLDGGKTWSQNKMVYSSPDTSVCECCKPSVVVKSDHVYVMFRNWIAGNRDMYLVQSTDGGKNFRQAEKLGKGTWALDGCPMDGGALAVDKNSAVQTVWRRKDKVYTAMPGMPEKEIGEGKGCTLETIAGKNVYAWTENGEIVFIKPEGQKQVLGKGSQPVVKALQNGQVICVWESEQQILASVLTL